ncbi:hypothetical protein G7046_g5025 [Stylonectria norvegica]|nr:hypothetical protein G7046_g5025 [Stylonectria norvegica]
MQFTTLLVSLIPLSSLATAGCYSGGESWGDQKAGVQTTLRDQLCQGTLSGHFDQGQEKSACMAMNDRHADFTVKRKTGPLDLSPSDCYFYFNREIDGCGNGGSTEYEDWIFTSDPNGGPC